MVCDFTAVNAENLTAQDVDFTGSMFEGAHLNFIPNAEKPLQFL